MNTHQNHSPQTEAPKPSSGWFARYRGLVISITVFLIIIASVLLFSLFVGRVTQQDNLRDATYAQIRDLTQSITRDLFNLSLNYGEDPNSPHLDYTIKRLSDYTNILSQNIDALEAGMPAQKIGGGNYALTQPATANELGHLNKISREWDNYGNLIRDYLKDAQSFTATSTPLDLAVYQAQESSETIYLETAEVAGIVEKRANDRAQLLQLIQSVGIAAIIVYFLIFIFFFIRRIIKGDRELAAARQETTEIMETIHEGLFLIDEDLQIGQQTSTQLANIVPGQTFSGQQMSQVLERIVDSKDVETARRFIKQLFNPRVDETLIQDLNPLNRIRIRSQDFGHINARYVRFRFTRVWDDDEIKRVLVSVTDITEAVLLEERLEKERQQNEQQIELLVKVLQIDPPLLTSFLRNANQLTKNVNAVLRRPDRKAQDLRDKAREIFRSVHSFKGEASALKLDRFVSNCETIEDRLKEVQNRSTVSGNDFIKVTIALDELIDRIQVVENLKKNLAHMTEHTTYAEESISDKSIKSYYQQFATEVAQRNHKSVDLIINHYDQAHFDESTQDQIKEIILQLIRNAVAHGIEDRSTRQANHKEQTGQLELDLSAGEDETILTFADDGAGINYQALKEKVKQHPQYAKQAHNLEHMSAAQLNRFLFMSGVSTAAQHNSDAGRGVGMDVIKDRLQQLGARIAIRSHSGRGTEFIIHIPHSV